MNGRGVNSALDAVGNIVRALSDGYRDPDLVQVVGDLGCGTVGTAHGKSAGLQELGKAAHADAADTDEVDASGCIQIKFKHNCSP